MMKSRTTKLIKIHRTIWTAHSTQRSLKRPWKPWRTRSPLAQTKSPMRCWNTLAPKQSQNSWESSTTAGRQGMFLRAGEKLTWYPSTRRARTEQIQTATVLSASPVVRANSWKEWSTLAWYGTWRRTTSSLQSRQAFGSTIPLRTRSTYIAKKIEDGFQDKQHTLTVWIDMEKAYDRVWKDGLRLKLQKSGVTGCMYQWISQYLTNRKARVHVNGTYSRKKTLKEGVPQGGVISPTLFLVFINDIVRDMPRKVQGAIYADDLVLWCSEEHLSTANYRMQQALNTLEGWTNQLLVKINSRKTTYTIFSLSTKEQKATLHINGQTLLAEDNPTYLGVTFDKRLTWRQQTEKAEARAKVRLALMKKLAGTTWGADTVTLKRLYTGRVRPVLEYGMTAWGTTAKSNFDRVSKVQNQATRIITGAMKSTPIMELETITGLQSLDDRRDLKLLSQAAKFKRLQDHPMRQRLSQPTKGRLKRESFVHQSRMLERRQEDILDHDPKEIPPCLAVPAWSGRTFPVIRCTIPGVGQKDSQSGPERKSHTQEYLETNYPKESWTHGYTDGSAENAVRNGGAGVYIKYAGGKEDKISLATGLYSTNYKAEAEALKTAAAHIEASTHTSLKVVLLTDALSVLQALQSNRDTEINDLSTALASLCRRHEVTLQWIPSHCNLPGNEAADSLAKEGTTKEQVDRSTSYPEVKTILKAKQHSKWRHKHPRYNKADPYYLLTRREQVTVFRLRTGHNRLSYHLYSKLRIGHTEQCPCGTGSQTTEHLLQFCPTYEPLRKGIWPDHTPLARKLYGSLRDLRCTATFIGETGISIWRTRRRRRSRQALMEGYILQWTDIVHWTDDSRGVWWRATSCSGWTSCIGQTTAEGFDGGLHPAVGRTPAEGFDGGLHPAVGGHRALDRRQQRGLMEGYILQWMDLQQWMDNAKVKVTQQSQRCFDSGQVWKNLIRRVSEKRRTLQSAACNVAIWTDRVFVCVSTDPSVAWSKTVQSLAQRQNYSL